MPCRQMSHQVRMKALADLEQQFGIAGGDIAGAQFVDLGQRLDDALGLPLGGVMAAGLASPMRHLLHNYRGFPVRGGVAARAPNRVPTRHAKDRCCKLLKTKGPENSLRPAANSDYRLLY